jgi:uncharacterized protein
MKIRRPESKLPLEKPVSIGKRTLSIKGSLKKESSLFEQELQASQKQQLTEKLKATVLQIDELGQRLIKIRTVDILNQYKELIKNFLKDVVQNLYLLKEEMHFDPKGKHKALVLVKTINKNLEDVVKMVLDKEISNLKLLEKVGEIKGMLIDLYS